MPTKSHESSLTSRTHFLKINPVRGNFDVAHLQTIHAYLFQDSPNLKPGQFRPEARGDWYKQREMFQETEKGIAPWISYSHMDQASLEKLSKILERANPAELSKLNKEQFTKEMASLYANLDYIHPFIEGNSRTFRAFTQQLSQEAGFDLRWENFDRLKERERNREILYITRDMAIYDLSLANIKTDHIREYVQGSKEYFQGRGYLDLETLLSSVITPKDHRLYREIDNLILDFSEQPQNQKDELADRKDELADRNLKAEIRNTEYLLEKENKNSMSEQSRNTSKKPSFAEEFAEKVIQQLEDGTAPWIKPWDAGELEFPYNASSGKKYHGMNNLRLVMEHRSDPRWMTYKQAKEAGAQVRKGEKSVKLFRLVTTGAEDVPKKDENGNFIKDENGLLILEKKKDQQLSRPFVKSFSVFNAEQIDGLPELERQAPDPEKEFKANARGEAILQASGAQIEHKQSASAFYTPQTDKITLPEKKQFHTESGYYSTALHELGHWTGHAGRLNRDLRHPFGSIGYAKEELRAELGSMMLAMELGTGYDPGNHAAYIKSWVQILKNDPEEIVRAARDAEKIKGMVMEFDKQLENKKLNQAQPGAEIYSIYDASPASDPDNFEEIFISHKLAENPQKIIDVLRGVEFPAQKLGWNTQWQAEKISDLPDKDKEILSSPQDLKNYIITKSNGSEDAIALIDMVFREKKLSLEQEKPQTIQSSTKDAVELTDLEAKEKAIALYNERHNLIGDDEVQLENDGEISISEGNLEEISKEIDVIMTEFAKRALASIDSPTLIHVPYTERKEAKALGAQWNAKEKSWFIPAGKDQKDFEKWLKPQEKTEQRVSSSSTISKEDSLANALREQGLTVPSELHFDGQIHRVAMTNDGNKKQSGYYAAFENDGRPAGTIGNWKTGQSVTWMYEGNQKLSKTEIEAAKIVAAQRKEAAEKAREELEEKTAKKVLSEFQTSFKTIRKPTPYMEKKEIQLTTYPAQKEREKEAGLESLYVKTDAKRNMIVPMVDVTGKLWNKQTIRPDGLKLFEKNAKKQGCFFPLNTIHGLSVSKKTDPVIIVEGLATGASIDQITDDLMVGGRLVRPQVIVAFDSGNLLPVAKAIREAFPEKPIIIAGDDDAHNVLTVGKNTGKEKAEEAAKAVNGRAILPIFPKAEKSWPENVPKFTPAEYLKGKISDEQRKALENFRKMTDFNDLATKSPIGKDIIASQIRGEISLMRSLQEKAKQAEKEKTQTVSPAPASRTVKAQSKGAER